MKEKERNFEIDMCNGPLLGKILLFSLPLLASGVLQLLFNAADVVVVGRFAGNESLAAVGSTTALINLIINLFLGLSIGANVIGAKYYGSENAKSVSETAHTSIALSLICGVILAVTGIFLAPFLLSLMGTPDDVMGLASVYVRIYFLGMPAYMLYNFGAALLRVSGDTRRPLYYLIFAGSINVILNLFFVIICKLGVAGVAIATSASSCISAFLVLRCLMRQNNSLKIDLKKLSIKKSKLMEIVRIGVPSGLQGMVFSLSNVVIQSTINSFGSTVIAGSSASASLEGFLFTGMSSFTQASITFTSRNLHAGKIERVKKVLAQCAALTFCIGEAASLLTILFGRQLVHIYSTDPAVIAAGVERLKYICALYGICGVMDVLSGSMRGLGYSVVPMLSSVIGACGLRILWIATIFKLNPTIIMLYYCYPISWIITMSANFVCFAVLYRMIKRRLDSMDAANAISV